MESYRFHKILTTIVLICVVVLGNAQSDLILFKTGEQKEVVLILDKIPGPNDILQYKELNSTDNLSIPMNQIQKLILSDGYVLYESEDPLPLKQENLSSEKQTVANPTDTILFTNGEVKQAILLLNEMPSSAGNLKYKLPNSDEVITISMQNIEQLILSDGYTIYKKMVESKEPKTIPEPEESSEGKMLANSEESTKKQTIPLGLDALALDPIRQDSIKVYVQVQKELLKQQNIACVQSANKLKNEIQYEAVMLFNQLKEETEKVRSKASIANFSMQTNVQEQAYAAFGDEIELLKCNNTSVDAVLTIEVDTAGKLVQFEDEVKSAEALRYYTQLRENSIKPYFQQNTFPTVDTLIDFSSEIKSFIQSKSQQVAAHSCQEEFEGFMALISSRFEELDKSIQSKNTIYRVPIKYSFKNVFQTWIYYNKKLQIVNKKAPNTPVTNPELVKEFEESTKKKPQAGKYTVSTCIYKDLNDSIQMTVMNVKKKYTYFIHFGVNVGTIIPTQDYDFDLRVAEVLPIEGMLVFHRFGLFGGYGLRTSNPLEQTSVDDGLYLTENSKYYQGGIYIGLGQFIYIKTGYSHLNRELVEYENGFEISRSNIEAVPGFIAGASLIFPGIQFESGYNYSFKAPYVSVGMNIPINK